MKYELHPLCTLFPRLSGADFEALKNDIRDNGLREPIIIHDGMILDGGNRYRACLEIGVDPGVMKFGGGNLVSYVISANLHRRHLTPGQQAAIVASAQDWAKAQGYGGARKGVQVATLPLETIKDRSSQSGASVRTQRMADKVAKVNPELAKKVGYGEISLPDAIKKITPKKEAVKQLEDNSEENYTARDFELDNLRDQNCILQEKVEELRDALATGQLPEDEIVSAEQTIIDLRKQVKTLEAEIDAVKSSRDIYQAENFQLKQQCRMYANKLKAFIS